MNTALRADPQAFKNAQREQWDRSAAGWNDHTSVLRAWLRAATSAMIEMAGVRPGHRVLDIAAGAGDQTLDLAARVGPEGEVLATDLSPAILVHAQAHARTAGFEHVRILVADGEDLPVPAGHFDAAVCRLGLMFFPQPALGLAQVHRALKPGGGFCALVFGAPEANPCVGLVMATALRCAGLPPRDPFQPGGLLSLGKAGHLDALMRDAGFRDVASTRLSAPFEVPSAAHYLAFLRSSASPVQQILERLDPAAEQAGWAEIEAQLHRFDTAQGWSGPNELLLAAGRR